MTIFNWTNIKNTRVKALLRRVEKDTKERAELFVKCTFQFMERSPVGSIVAFEDQQLPNLSFKLEKSEFCVEASIGEFDTKSVGDTMTLFLAWCIDFPSSKAFFMGDDDKQLVILEKDASEPIDFCAFEMGRLASDGQSHENLAIAFRAPKENIIEVPREVVENEM